MKNRNKNKPAVKKVYKASEVDVVIIFISGFLMGVSVGIVLF